jgi:hypothetical protein
VVHGNGVISHVGISQVGGRPTHHSIPGGHNTHHVVLPTVQEVQLGRSTTELSDEPLATGLANFMPLQCWIASELEKLKSYAREAFHNSMTKAVLVKNNKLEKMVMQANSPNLLSSIKNLKVKLKAIIAHLHSHEIL